MKRVLLATIRLYQRAISPALPAACRYQPTCSRYAYEAIERHGALRGGFFAFRRLSRCVPWKPGGFDPVPGGSGPLQTYAGADDLRER
ncbi:MAG: membrane protein insertion efficiency factor YidD [Dehalococcoidia bacterium]